MKKYAFMNMTLAKSKPWVVLCVFLFWIAIAVIATSTAFIAMRGNSFVQWFATFQPMFVYYTSWAIISLFVYRLIDRPIKTLSQALVIVGLNVGVLAIMVIGMPFIIHYDQWQQWLYGDRATGFRVLGGAVFLFILVANLALKYYQKGVEQTRLHAKEQQKNYRLEGELNRIRVDTLMMQVNPHFLFNSLNSITALIETEDKSKAYDTTISLGDLLRLTLERSEQQMTTLGEELTFIEQYLALEQVRFSDQLAYTSEVDDSLKSYVIPAFILQPIVENTIKHAVGKTNRLVSIKLKATAGKEAMRLRVTDDGPGLGKHFAGSLGVGLSNIQRRLEILYNRNDLFLIEENSGAGMAASITIPVSLARI
jgi:sensor histidine kinase YesM